MPNNNPQNIAHTKLYRELKREFTKRQIPRHLFKETIHQVKLASKHTQVNWDASTLGGAFGWVESPQGHAYWGQLEHLIRVFPMPNH